MTNQRTDVLIIDGREFEVIAINDDFSYACSDDSIAGLPDPDSYDIDVQGYKHGERIVGCTGNARGYVRWFKLDADRLMWDRLEILSNWPGNPPINGVAPTLDEYWGATYTGINLELSFTGRLCIRQGLFQDLNMDFSNGVLVRPSESELRDTVQSLE